MSMKVIRSTETFTTSREMAYMRSLSSVNEHMTLKMFVSLETPGTERVLASVLVLSGRAIQVSTGASTLGWGSIVRCSGLHRISRSIFKSGLLNCVVVAIHQKVIGRTARVDGDSSGDSSRVSIGIIHGHG